MVPSSNLHQPADLEQLARARFAPLSDAEIKLLRAAPKGETAYCGPSVRDDDPNNNPADSDSWGSERWIRAELVRWLCVDRDAKDCVDPRGLRAHAAGIRGKLDLSFVVVPFFLELVHCSISDDLDLRFIEVPSIELTGTCLPSLNTDHSTVKGNISLQGLRSKGTVQLRGAHIGGNLECDGGKSHNPAVANIAESGRALDAEGAKVARAVLRRNGFAAEGTVWLYGVEIGGTLDCDDGKFHNPAVANVVESGSSLIANGAKVGGAVLLRDGFAAEGVVVLSGAEIGGNLGCDGGKFHNPAVANVAGSGKALIAEGAKVAGGVLLRNGFAAEGAVELFGAQIGGNLDCDGGKFQNPAVADVAGSGRALIANGAKVGGAVLLRDGFAAEGMVWLSGVEIGGNLDCDGGKFQNPAVANLAESGRALIAEGAKVAGGVYLRNRFAAEGTVWLSGAEIGGSLDCDGGKFQNAAVAIVAESGRALIADGAKVARAVYFRNGFAAEGMVRLFGAEIGGNLECDRGKFQNPEVADLAGSGRALDAEGAKVARAVYLRNGFAAKGQVRLYRAQIGGNLECQFGTFESLDLTNASAGAILDDEKSWPKAGKLLLDGFAYGRIA